jgi:hypothetical protein
MKVPSLEVQALVFFAGCTLAGLLFVALAIFGSIPNRGLIAVLGAIGAVTGGRVVLRGVRSRRSQRRPPS